MRDAIAAVGASICFVPPYAPDLDPLELLFAKLEAPLENAARRTIDDLVQAIANALDRFTPTECANDPRHARYPPQPVRNLL